MCGSGLAALTVRKQPTLVERDHLGRTLRQLVKGRFLRPTGLAKRTGAVRAPPLVFDPAFTFFADYDIYRRPATKANLL